MEQEIRDFIEAFKKQNDDQARKAMITGRLISKSNKEQDNFTKELKKSVDQLKKEGKLKDEELETLKISMKKCERPKKLLTSLVRT